MKENNGFIQIPRSLLTHPAFLDAPDIYCKMLCYIIAEMAYDKCMQNDHGVALEIFPYEYMLTDRSLARIFNVHHSKVQRMIAYFQKHQILRQEVRHTKTVIIVEYLKTYNEFRKLNAPSFAPEMRQDCAIKEEVKKEKKNKRSDDSDDMANPLKAPLHHASPASPLLHKEKKGRGHSFRENYCEDWANYADQANDEKFPMLAEMVNRYQIPEKDICLWLKKHTVDKIFDTILLMEIRKPEWKIEFKNNITPIMYVMLCNPQMIRWIQTALLENWAQQEKNRTINQTQIPQLIKANNMEHLFDFTQDYCRCKETKNDFQYSLDPKTLYDIIQRKLQAMLENMAESIA